MRGTAASLADRFVEPPKGEVTLVVGPGVAALDVDGALSAVGDLVAAGAPRGVAAEVVSRLSGVPRHDRDRGPL